MNTPNQNDQLTPAATPLVIEKSAIVRLLKSAVDFYRPAVIPAGKLCDDCHQERATVAYGRRVMLCARCDENARCW